MTIDITPLVKIKANEKADRNKTIYEFYISYKGPKYEAEEILADRYDITERRVRAIVLAYKKKFQKGSIAVDILEGTSLVFMILTFWLLIYVMGA